MAANKTVRVPITPLSMKNSNAALNNELLVDYENYEIYIHANGDFYNVTASINNLINEITKRFKNDQELMLDIFKSEVAGIAIGEAIIRTDDGGTTTIREYIYNSRAEINNIKTELEKTNEKITTEVEKNVTEINNQITTINQELDKIKNTEVVSAAQISSWDSKAKVMNEEIIIPANGWTTDPETNMLSIDIACEKVIETDKPFISLISSNDNYDTIVTEMKNLNRIYKAFTFDGFIRLLAFKALDTEIKVNVKIDRTTIPDDTNSTDV